MAQPDCFIFYVDNPAASARLYTDLLGRGPVETSDNFVLFLLDSGAKLGLWRKPAVTPVVPVGASGGEWAFSVDTPAGVEALYERWRLRGMAIAQAPTWLDFGYSFVAIDHDGHRLRVYAPERA
jgi:catechol 2,3-dioxygenase-like lactoylglutathione lyase family enzyme